MPMTVAARRTFPPVVTASAWPTAWLALREAAAKRNGMTEDFRAHAPTSAHPGMFDVAHLTNADAVALIQAWLSAVPDARKRFPLWYQFAAIAYGWSVERDKLDTSAARGARLYPTAAAQELWRATSELSLALDAEGVPSPRLETDGRFDDLVFAGSVAAALREDGAEASWVIGFGGCKGPDGKPSKPRRNPDTGKWECEPVPVEDPVTVGKRKATGFATVAALVFALWLLDSKPRRRRRD